MACVHVAGGYVLSVTRHCNVLRVVSAEMLQIMMQLMMLRMNRDATN